MIIDPTGSAHWRTEMNPGDCAPLQCETAMNCINGVRDPLAAPTQWGQLRSQLDHCPGCQQAFDLEVRLRTTVTPTTSELPTFDFRMRVTETLAAVDLSQLDVSDIDF